MSFKEFRIGQQLLGISNCPICQIASPLLVQVWHSGQDVPRNDGGFTSIYAAYRCTSCGGIVTAKGDPGVSNPFVSEVIPAPREIDSALPQRARRYLEQAMGSLANPDASVVMSASAIDAMLKDIGHTEGSLYKRIEDAVEEGALTATMAQWAHRVRLDANAPRHADLEDPHSTPEEASRAFEFAIALGQFLYVIPSKMPPQQEQTGE